MEQALSVRIDFLQFCGLSLSDAIPDETTLCRFRNRLVSGDRLDDLLASINEQLQSHGLMIKGATGAVIDATLRYDYGPWLFTINASNIFNNHNLPSRDDSADRGSYYLGTQPTIVGTLKLRF